MYLLVLFGEVVIMYTGLYRGEPSKEVKKEFEYWRKAAVAMDNNQKIRHWIYRRLAIYWERKFMKRFTK